MKKSKWFTVVGQYFSTNREKEAENLSQGWDKTLEKWRLVVKGFVPTHSISTCGLCDLFNNTESGGQCTKCPVKKKTGLVFCEGTPYPVWCKSSTKENAKVELAFLRLVKKQSYKPKVKKGK